MRINNSIIIGAAVAIGAFALGFVYGNIYTLKYQFVLKEWQPSLGTLVTLGVALLAFLGVRTTQRVNVIKEQERIDDQLPDWRQVSELLTIMRGPLESLRPQARYQALLVLDS